MKAQDIRRPTLTRTILTGRQSFTFHEDDFQDLVKRLWRLYPDHMVGLAILEHDFDTEITRAKFLAITPFAALIGIKGTRFREKHPNAHVRVFSTQMGAPAHALLR